jgi:hypothetical protein
METVRGAGRSWFHAGAAAAALLVALGGFSVMYFGPLRAGEFRGPLALHVQAAVFFGWLALFLTQSLLVRARHIGAHRRLGAAGLVLAPLMIASGAYVALVLDAVAAGLVGGDGVGAGAPGAVDECRDPRAAPILRLGAGAAAAERAAVAALGRRRIGLVGAPLQMDVRRTLRLAAVRHRSAAVVVTSGAEPAEEGDGERARSHLPCPRTERAARKAAGAPATRQRG